MKKIAGIVFFTMGCCILAGLGIWQIQRAEWKSGIIKELETEYAKPAFSQHLNFSDMSGETIRRGYVKGKFLKGKSLYWPKVNDGVLGFYVMHPFILEGRRIVLVNIGWVPENPHTHLPMENINVPVQKNIIIDGIARRYEAGRWSLSNKPAENRWYQYKPEQISNYLRLKENLPDFIFFANQVQPEGLLILGDIYGAQIYPRDNHYQYAVFWFSLFIIWVLILGRVVFYKRTTI